MLAGGHSVQDEEPKYGLVVFGEVKRDMMWTVGTAAPGHTDTTKPIGTGIVTAIKAGCLTLYIDPRSKHGKVEFDTPICPRIYACQ